MRKKRFSRFRSHSHKNDCVSFRSGPFQKAKIKRTVPKHSQKLCGTKKWTRNPNDMQTYRSVLVWTEKQVQFRSTFFTCLVSAFDTKLVSITTSDRSNFEGWNYGHYGNQWPNYTSLIVLIVPSFKTDIWRPRSIYILFLWAHVDESSNVSEVYYQF